VTNGNGPVNLNPASTLAASLSQKISPAGSVNPDLAVAPAHTEVEQAIHSAVTSDAVKASTNQTVVWSSQKVDHIAEVLTTLNVSSYASIKYGNVQAGGSGTFVNEKKFNESDLNYIVSAKVTNEPDHKDLPRMTFQPIPNLTPEDFTGIFGDCFVVDFLRGGNFTALILVNCGASSDAKAVEEALNLQLQTGIPGLSVGAGQAFEKKKADVLSDCQVTISVSWTGGGTVRSGKQNWTLDEVIEVANLFPNLVAQNSQRISAVLMSYNALRSFQETQVMIPKKMLIRDYTIAKIYAKELCSIYMAYRTIWEELTAMMTDPDQYQAHSVVVDGKAPIGTDPVSLNIARMEARDQMVRIAAEADSMRSIPQKLLLPDPDVLDSILGGAGDKELLLQKVQSVYKFPALLKARLPRYVGAPFAVTDDLWKDGNWTPDEMAVIMNFTTDKEHLSFSPPVGEVPKGSKGKAFCTIDASSRNKQPPKYAFCPA